MATEKRLISVDEAKSRIIAFATGCHSEVLPVEAVIMMLNQAPTVDAVEVPDKELLRAIKLLIKQYEHSKNSDYVHNPVAHALFHTWRQVDERRPHEKT